MKRTEIDVTQLRVGLYIELPLKWHEHPFLFSKFLLKDEGQLALIRQLGVRKLWYYPDKSSTEPAGLTSQSELTSQEAMPDNKDEIKQAWDLKAERYRELKRKRQAIQQTERNYREVLKNVKDMMFKMNSLPVQAVHEADGLVSTLMEKLLHQSETVIHLMSSNNLDDSVYYHALNVSVLCLLLGRDMELPPEQIKLLGLAALLHDIGQSKLPSSLLRKTEPYTKAEADFYEMHAFYGAELIRKANALESLVETLVGQHHEFMDGSGYPKKLQGDAIHPLSQILCLVKHYDRLCNHLDPRQSLTPHEALSLMFAKLSQKFAKLPLQRLVKLLGIYPPGTLVQLSDESIGMVISLNKQEMLKPSILIYNEEIPKDQAVIIDLIDSSELSIKKSLRPIQLTAAQYEYLSPRERVSYFFEIKKRTRDVRKT